MAKYHIAKDGTAKVCGAQQGNCPLGDDTYHSGFDNAEDAQKWAEDRLAESYGNVPRKYVKASKEVRLKRAEETYENARARFKEISDKVGDDFELGKSQLSVEMMERGIEFYEAQADRNEAEILYAREAGAMTRLKKNLEKGGSTAVRAANSRAQVRNIREALEIRKGVGNLEGQAKADAVEKMQKLLEATDDHSNNELDDTLADQNFEKIDALARELHSASAAKGPRIVHGFDKTSDKLKEIDIDASQRNYDELYFSQRAEHFHNARNALNIVLEEESDTFDMDEAKGKLLAKQMPGLKDEIAQDSWASFDARNENNEEILRKAGALAGKKPSVEAMNKAFDRSAGRWCERCGQNGSHHTEDHDGFAQAARTLGNDK